MARRKRRTPANPAIERDNPQPNRQTEDVLVGTYERARRVVHEHVLDVYARRGQITERQHEAGLVFRKHWERGMVQRVTSPPDGSQTTGSRGAARRDLTEGQLQSRSLIKRLLEAQRGGLERRLLIRVGGHGQWAGEALRASEGLTDPRGVIGILQRVLRDVADELGMPGA